MVHVIIGCDVLIGNYRVIRRSSCDLGICEEDGQWFNTYKMLVSGCCSPNGDVSCVHVAADEGTMICPRFLPWGIGLVLWTRHQQYISMPCAVGGVGVIGVIGGGGGVAVAVAVAVIVVVVVAVVDVLTLPHHHDLRRDHKDRITYTRKLLITLY